MNWVPASAGMTSTDDPVIDQRNFDAQSFVDFERGCLREFRRTGMAIAQSLEYFRNPS